MKQKISKIKDAILNLIFPKNIKCMFCTGELNQNSYNVTCENCLETLPFITNDCERCGSQIGENQTGVCLKCKNTNYYFNQAKSVFVYVDKPLNVVHNLKYNGKKFLAEYMVKYMLDVYAKWNAFVEIVTYVPMFKQKEKARGYNQAKLLAEEFSKNVNIPCYNLCSKVVDTSSQTQLDNKARMKNVEDSFAFNNEFKDTVNGKRILIIDDVITTGATTSEISKVLKAAGAKECYVLSFAHTQLRQINVEQT